ncbi:MAG: capsule assembly Wzi family protein [Bacteroidales bacterium]|nr:capsule assembly Wzi family protein [Bacteroidales bacterium]
MTKLTARHLGLFLTVVSALFSERALALGRGSDSLSVVCEAWASVASNKDLRPLLSYSNQWGRFTQYDQTELAAGASVAYAHEFHNPRVKFRSGVSGLVSSDSRRTMLGELYADFDLWMFGVKMGMENFTPVETNTLTSVGSYIMSNNARPVPRAWVGIFDYWSIPFDRLPFRFAHLIKDAVQIRGGFSVGRMDDEGEAAYTDDILLHEKFAYGRLGLWYVKPYIGLCHSVVMGGTLSDGTKVPIDFWNSVFGRHGDPAVFGVQFRGETTNAAGGHQGMWDLGLDFDLPNGASGKVYYQRNFADNKNHGFVPDFKKDCSFGVQVSLPSTPFVKMVSLEFVKTDWQGGEGLPDPYVPTQGGDEVLYWPGDINAANFEHIRNDILIANDIREWQERTGQELSLSNYMQFFADTYNGGHEYGGRSKYLTNWNIEQGWTRGGLSMGSPLFHTAETVRRYAPAGSMKLGNVFPNLRVRAVNIGLAGDIVQGRVAYVFRATFTRNSGNYCEKYKGNSEVSWDLWDGYYFASSRNETYLMLNLRTELCRGLSLCTDLAYDFGQLYRSFSARAGISYAIGRGF